MSFLVPAALVKNSAHTGHAQSVNMFVPNKQETGFIHSFLNKS